jgi:cytochrome c
VIKSLLVCIALAGLVIGGPAHSQETPPPSDQANAVEALVTGAAALIEKDGKTAAIAQFRMKDSEWLHGDTYLFACDLTGKILLNAAFPKSEGTKIGGGFKDAKGKPFQDDMLKVAAEQGSGWVSYLLPKPGQAELYEKWTYVKKVMLDGTPGLIASGFYLPTSASAFGHEQIAMSWQTITLPDRVTVVDPDSATGEGTATFANGEKAQFVLHSVHPRTNSLAGGTVVSDWAYKFDDGSGFTMREVAIWNGSVFRASALLSEGTGRFAGMAGSATGVGKRPFDGVPFTALWTGTYELLEK